MERSISFKPEHVCSREINVVVEDGIVKDVRFVGGCPGNTLGVSTLTKGRKVEEVIALLEHIECPRSGSFKTSCPQELAKALKQAI
ncbi:MAG: TIGR03905 family TSCPD domain-containing protein [Bacilli bacterium]|nr:TIGR03905 family TSCPD domain-containing protein [Bacilli bacterium]